MFMQARRVTSSKRREDSSARAQIDIKSSAQCEEKKRFLITLPDKLKKMDVI